VKLTVETPKLGWGGATHEDIGELVEIVESSRGSGKIMQTNNILKVNKCFFHEVVQSLQ